LAAASDVELAARLRLAITRTARRLRQEAGTDLSPSQVAALATIECHGPLAPSEVAERERIRRPTATRVLARLVEAGLVERIPDPADGRSAIVSVSSEGRALLGGGWGGQKGGACNPGRLVLWWLLRPPKTAYLATRIRDLPPQDLSALARATEVLESILARDADGEAA
jgi:DNA-binding MarR family transcriptional regulator